MSIYIYIHRIPVCAHVWTWTSLSRGPPALCKVLNAPASTPPEKAPSPSHVATHKRVCGPRVHEHEDPTNHESSWLWAPEPECRMLLFMFGVEGAARGADLRGLVQETSVNAGTRWLASGCFSYPVQHTVSACCSFSRDSPVLPSKSSF